MVVHFNNRKNAPFLFHQNRAASSSGITPSVTQSECKRPERCLVGHPSPDAPEDQRSIVALDAIVAVSAKAIDAAKDAT